MLRLAKSLEKYSYLTRMQDGRYVLGSKLFHLGSVYQRHFQTSAVVPPVLKEIARKLNEGASFYVQDGDHRIPVRMPFRPLNPAICPRVAVIGGDSTGDLLLGEAASQAQLCETSS